MTNEPVMREVLTKAVCGKGEILQQNVVDLVVNNSEDLQILGSYITRAKLNKAVPFTSATNKKMVKVEGLYEIHVWYAAGQDTYSGKKTVNYVETIPIATYGDDDFTDAEAHAHIALGPKCKKTYVKKEANVQVIKVEVEQGLAVEVTGLTKLFVKAIPFVPKDAEVVSGKELIPPKFPASGMLVPEFFPGQMDDLSDYNEDDFIK